ncbi:MAG: tRNA-dihydrouridine synthase family protein [Eubacteriales bacterium]|nr:tRNA-dihydrouridine synthase family protein [Eubacteriales bacterium]
MNFYLAPLEGITTYIYRRNYHKYFSPMDKYFAPFVTSAKLNYKERMDLTLENNPDAVIVPQVMSKHAEEFLSMAETMASLGYHTVNLNLGCPSGTVVAKGRGAGMLASPEALDQFLDQIFSQSPIKISLKTRIGISDPEEWEALIPIYQKYPVEELIIHPRLQKDFYKGVPRMDAFAAAVSSIQAPLCYNGDISSVSDYQTLVQTCPALDRVMIGRGVLKNPALLAQIRQEPLPTKDTIRSFHDDIFQEYRERMSGDRPALCKMIELWTYLKDGFTNPENYMKKIRKSKHCSDYLLAVDALFKNEDYQIPKP